MKQCRSCLSDWIPDLGWYSPELCQLAQGGPQAFPPGVGWALLDKSGSPGNLGQTSSRLQITHDGLMEDCQSEQRQGLMDIRFHIHRHTHWLTYCADTRKPHLPFKLSFFFLSFCTFHSFSMNSNFTKLVVQWKFLTKVKSGTDIRGFSRCKTQQKAKRQWCHRTKRRITVSCIYLYLFYLILLFLLIYLFMETIK